VWPRGFQDERANYNIEMSVIVMHCRKGDDILKPVSSDYE